jgi:4-alpha-glucanotransferase
VTDQPRDSRRVSGVLLHVTSLPGRGIGDVGEPAFRWIDWLADAGQSLWQILPLVPVNHGGSPYNGLSAMASNDLLISLESLVGDGLLDAGAIGADGRPRGHLDFEAISRWKEPLLRSAFLRFRDGGDTRLHQELEAYRRRQTDWIEDYALFRAVRDDLDGAPWSRWPTAIRLREPGAIAEWRERLRDRIDEHVFRQFLFDRQWRRLHRYAAERGVAIMGDIPIFVAHDSADVWAHRDMFWLDDRGQPTVVAGVPPDYFSESGQRWGNPLYRWDRMADDGYAWWIERFRRALEHLDMVRLDHFRGFEAYWEIPASEQTALNGRWVPGPREALFHAAERALGPLPIVAEDLGLITPEVDALRERLGIPGMRVLQFAFDGDPANPHLPANYEENTVAYTGTHDNATTAEWWDDLDPSSRRSVQGSFHVHDRSASRDLAGAVLGSRARMVVVPLQDVLGLGREARMNTPGTLDGNWIWRADAAALDSASAQWLRAITRESGRCVASDPPTVRVTGETAER